MFFTRFIRAASNALRPAPVEIDTMQILVDRNWSDSDVTLSDVYVDGVLICHGLEDEYRAKKIWGETRIPAGTYRVGLRTFGGFHQRHSVANWSRDHHEGMLWVRDVPGFESILLHTGNSDKDTAGCLILGSSRDEKNGKVWLSRAAYRKLYKLVLPAAKSGRLSITYADNDGVRK